MVNAVFVCDVPPSVESGVFQGLKEGVKSLTSGKHDTALLRSLRG